MINKLGYFHGTYGLKPYPDIYKIVSCLVCSWGNPWVFRERAPRAPHFFQLWPPPSPHPLTNSVMQAVNAHLLCIVLLVREYPQGRSVLSFVARNITGAVSDVKEYHLAQTLYPPTLLLLVLLSHIRIQGC